MSDLQRAYTVDTAMDVDDESETNSIRNNITMENVASTNNQINDFSLLDELTFDPQAASTSKSRHKNDHPPQIPIQTLITNKLTKPIITDKKKIRYLIRKLHLPPSLYHFLM